MDERAEQILNGLSEKERQQVLSILSEYQKSGQSKQFNDIKYADYKEIPVDIITFIKDRKYLGDAWHEANGKCKLYPYWEKRLKEIFPDNLTMDYNSAIFTGSRGLGKSEMAVTIGLYLMYKVMCLKNPHDYFGLKPTEKIAFAFLNITIELAQNIGVSKFQETVKLSPWFMERGTLTPRTNLWQPPAYINLIIGSQSSDVIGQPILFAFFDEISFIKLKDIEGQKKVAIDMIDTAIGGMKTRFIKNGVNYSLLILASSKRTEKSFLETHMKAQAQIEGVRNFIVDEAVWNVKPPETYCGERFNVALGNKYLQSETIPDGEDVEIYRRKGYKILSVPIEFYAEFRLDIDRALCDYAGIASSDLSTYISGIRLAEAKTYEWKNPFVNDVIEVSDDPQDVSQYYDYLDETLINPKYKRKPLFVHLDMSISGDKTGIGGVWIIGLNPQTKEMMFQEAFVVSIKAPKGRQISFAKNKQFIRDLRRHGWNVCGVSSDTFQNAAVAQDLQSDGFKYQVISVDRVNNTTDKICEPYLFFKNAIYNKRIILYDTPLLTEELLSLERNNNTGKIDHPANGCFTGETLVSLVDGREVSFLDLVKEFQEGKQNFVYSFNENTKCIEPKLITNAWCTGHNRPLVEVTLDNGEVIKCTPDHRFMLRDGSYCEAQFLTPNQSLMPLYRKYSNRGLNGYRLYYEPMEDGWHYEHRKFAEEVDDDKRLVHHKNCNKKDNSPSNLIWMSKKRHQQIHAEMQTGAHSTDAEAKRSRSLSEYYSNNRDNPIFIERNRKISATLSGKHISDEHTVDLYEKNRIALHRVRKRLIKTLKTIAHRRDIEETFGVDYQSLSCSQKNSYGVRLSRMRHPEIQERISAKISENHKLGKYEKAYSALQECNEHRHIYGRADGIIQKSVDTRKANGISVSEETRKKIGIATSNKRWYNNGTLNIYIDKDEVPPEGFVKGRIKTWKNHKVVSVRFIDERADVYDITVSDNHNFALSSGVFVHNSKDASDAICGAIWNASQHQEEYAYEYGEDLMSSIPQLNSPIDSDVHRFQDEFERQLSEQHRSNMIQQQQPYYTISPEVERRLKRQRNIQNGILVW